MRWFERCVANKLSPLCCFSDRGRVDQILLMGGHVVQRQASISMCSLTEDTNSRLHPFDEEVFTIKGEFTRGLNGLESMSNLIVLRSRIGNSHQVDFVE